jgi:hypothetical protein
MTFQNHLPYRQTIFDFCALAGLIWAAAAGLVWPLFQQDTSFISHGIVVLALVGKVSLTMCSLKVSRAKNAYRAGTLRRIKPNGFKAKQAHLRFFTSACVLLGLFGTLVGIRESIQGIDPNSDYADMIVEVVAGVFVAINTSLVGVVASLWLGAGMLMLNTATVTLLEDVNG